MNAPSPAQKGFILIVVLAFVVLLTSVMLALFIQSQLSLTSERAATNTIQAELLGQSALEVIVNDLRQEMLAGSDLATRSNGFLAMRPATEKSVVPSRVVASTLESNSHFANLIKQSLRERPSRPSSPASAWPASGDWPAVTRASALSTADPSANGRSILPARWNSPHLTSEEFTTADQVPDWILISRGGINAEAIGWNSSFADPQPGNPSFIIGRYAYQIYDIGGLLDANAAGYPAGADTSLIAGTLASVDLSRLPGGGPVAEFFSWRNKGVSNYPDFVLRKALNNGYLTGGSDNRLLVSRMDLIKLAEDQNFISALSYLTHFSREKNSPAWGPTADAADLGGVNGSAHAYRTNANTPTATNRFLPHVRFAQSGSVTRYSDEGIPSSHTIRAGEPLLQKRFSLAKLKWIGPEGPQNGGTPESIRACFGLLWNGSAWDYVGSGSAMSPQSAIKTLEEVATENTPREPNFFELLQTGILSGSLGRDNLGYSGLSPGLPYEFQRSAFLQILTIGANLIDQYDDDAFPTIIRGDLAGQPVRMVGSEALPHLDRFKDIGGASPSNPAVMSSYLIANLWNPYRPENTPGEEKTPRTRIRVQGYYRQDSGWAKDASTAYPYLLREGVIDGATEIPKTAYSSFTSGTTPLTTANASPGGGWESLPTINGVQYIGFRMPDAELDPARDSLVNSNTGNAYVRARYLVTHLGSASDPFACTLEFLDPNTGDWVPYSYTSGIDDPATWRQNTLHYTGGATTTTGVPPAFSTAGLRSGAFRFKSDPRSMRFNEHQFDNATATDAYLSPLSSLPSGAMQLTPNLFGTDWKATWTPYALSRNNTTSTTESYADPDGVRRLADAGLFSGDWSGNTPYTTATLRPKILNRPFRAVSEMGMAFRDQPWKSLDFFTDKSADAGLLELFSLVDEPPLRAGVLNLNTRNADVLAAVLQDNALATQVINHTTDTPLASRGDLSRLAMDAFATTGNAKEFREAPLQILSSSGQARTWNLLIDVIVQTGRYPTTATTLAGFTVEGQKRYWLSLALDRYTGEVIAQSLEPAYD